MINIGRHITRRGDQLHPISVERLYHGLTNPKPEFVDQIQQLRAIQAVNPQQYRSLKTNLPYFVCAAFHPSVRLTTNFVSTEYALLDMDHLAEAGLTTDAVKRKLATLPELLLTFTSPSSDGVKALFRLNEKCKDAGAFSAFYRLFAHEIAVQLGLEKVLDIKTSDVTRACFMSIDPEAIYAADAKCVDWQAILNRQPLEKAMADLKEKTKEIPAIKSASKLEPEPDILAKIKARLHPKSIPQRQKKEFFVPAEIESLMQDLLEQISDYELTIASHEPINYGRQLRITAGALFCELNIFYGRKGFTVVQTTKSGSNKDLAQLAAQVVHEILDKWTAKHLPNNSSNHG